MSGYGFFSSSIMGMRSQSHALDVIGTNIANVNTGGYKRVDTHFSSLLSDTLFEQSDLGGPATKDYFRISGQGNVVSSNLDTDIAIGGDGFFILNTKQDGSGDTVYSRDGSFRMAKGEEQDTVTYPDNSTVTVDTGYLVDKNGYYVMGVAANDDGTFTIPGSLEAIRIDPYAFVNQGTATTNAQLVLNLDANEPVNGSYRYTIEVYDSAGARQNVNLDFTANDVLNQWSVSASNALKPAAQIDTVTVAGSIEAGDTYTVDVDGTPVTYTVTGAEADIDAVRDAIVDAINADATVGGLVTAAAGADTGELTLTAVTAGTGFTTTTTATQGLASIAQVDTVTLAGTVEAGDTYTVTVDGYPVTYTVTGAEADIDAVRDNLVAAINAHGVVGPLVTAAPGGAGELTLTAATAGTPFSATSIANNVALGVADNAATLVNTTAGYAALNDNALTKVTTVANAADTTTQALGNIQFLGNGEVDTPQNLTLDLNFTGGTTANVTLDISKMTQYAGAYSPRSYEHDGRAAADMVSWNFDAGGHISATFTDNSVREVYQLPLGVFSNPDGLDVKNGMTFMESADSGEVNIVSAGSQGHAVFLPNSLELSNVVIEDQFSKLIMTQTAYNASATSFKTVDEMTSVAKDMKR